MEEREGPERRYIGKSVEAYLREQLARRLSEDPEALKLAYELLEAFATGGARGVRAVIEEKVRECGCTSAEGGG